MTTEEKLNNVLGYLTAMSFDKPKLSNDLVEPLNTLSEAISEIENLSLYAVSQQRELLVAYANWENEQLLKGAEFESHEDAIEIFLTTQ